MTDTYINTHNNEGIGIIELTNPPANAYSYAMFQQMDAAILEARMDDSIHVILLRGQGDKFFSSGADIAMLKTATPSFKYNFCLHANETLLRLEQTPKLVIAAINGHCVGGGLEIALAADIRIAKEECLKIGMPEITLGVLPGTGGTQRLSRLLGKSKAIDLMIQGTLCSPQEALAMNLINAVFPAQSFNDKAIDYAKQFLPPHKASKAVGAIKRAVQTGLETSLSSGLALERELQQQLFTSDDAAHAIAAYLNKETPVFSGK